MRKVLVTGAGTGIGRGIALKFAACGYDVAAVDLDAGLLKETAALAQAEGNAIATVTADLSTREGIAGALAEAIAMLGGLDVLACNAGIFPSADFATMDEETFDRTVAVNLKGTLFMVQAALPHLARSGSARVILTTSMGGNRTVTPGLCAYEASKAGVTGLMRNLTIELAPRGITVNAVEPGLIATERVSERFTPEAASELSRRVPLGRLGSPADIAAAFLFFASEEAGYVTGQSLAVAGGVELTDGLASHALRSDRAPAA